MNGYWNENEAKWWLNEHCLPFTDFALANKNDAVIHDGKLWYPMPLVTAWLCNHVY